MVYFMGLIRLLLWLAIAYFVWLNVKSYLRKQEIRKATRAREQQQIPERIVKCAQCGLHLPEPEALAAGDRWFCTDDHRQRWLRSRNS